MQLLTMFTWGRRLGAFLTLLGLLVLALPATVMAQAANELYAVNGVAVDITAENAAAARDKAIAEGQRNALAQLLTRMGADYDVTKLADADIANLVRDFEIMNERTSSIRYLATFSVRFKPEEVRTLLQNNGVSYSELRSKPVLVLPVMPSHGRPVLWEEPTPWRVAWSDIARTDGLVPLIVPDGELKDVSKISTTELLQGNTKALANIATANDAGGIIVPIIAVEAIDPKQQLTVTINRYDAAGNAASPVSVNIPPQPEGDSKTMLDAAADTIRNQLEQGWKQATRMVASGPTARLPVTVPIQSLQDWATIRQQLTRIPTISKVDMITLTRDSAHIEIAFQGDINQLRIALAQYDLGLDQGTSAGAWELHNRNQGENQ